MDTGEPRTQKKYYRWLEVYVEIRSSMDRCLSVARYFIYSGWRNNTLILQKNREWAAAQDDGTTRPEQEPYGNYQTQAGTDAPRTRKNRLITATEAAKWMVNWTKVKYCQQEPEEHPSAFLTRLEKQLQVFGEINPAAKHNRPLVVSLFVDQAAPGIKKHFTKHFPVWKGKSMAELTSIATLLCNGRDKEKDRQKRKQQKEETSFLAAALLSRDFTGRQRNDRNQGCRNQHRDWFNMRLLQLLQASRRLEKRKPSHPEKAMQTTI